MARATRHCRYRRRSARPVLVCAHACMQGRCDGPPPDDFNLTEPLPPGACALRVREDFLDAPLGTTCLLLDSLYVLVAPRAEVMTSSVLILHVRPSIHVACIRCPMHSPPHAFTLPCICCLSAAYPLPHPLPPSHAWLSSTH